MSFELKVLVTGFLPFQGDAYNPSGATAEWLNGKRVYTAKNHQIGRIFGRGRAPVRFMNEGNGGAKYVEALIFDVRPDIVINLGMADEVFLVEQQGGDLFKDDSIRPNQSGYESCYATTLPTDVIVKAIKLAGGVVSTNLDAGGFVCEDVFYHVMRLAKTKPGKIRLLRAGFIHVPRCVVLEDGEIPNELYGASPVPQSLINDAILRAVEATVADVTKDQIKQSRKH